MTPEDIVRRLAKAEPFYDDGFDETLCAVCGEPADAHAEDCPWLAARYWTGEHDGTD